MTPKLTWFFFFLIIYWSFCLFWGARTVRKNQTPESFYLANREITPWVFFFSATVATFGGLITLNYPALVFSDGYSFIATFAICITIPLGSTLFFKRQWMLSRKYNFISPGEMYFAYYKSEAIRIVVIIIGLLFALPFVGVLLGASGALVNFISMGEISRDLGMWIVTAVVLFYVVTGGFKSMISVGVVQSWLFFILFAVLGLSVFYYLGGLSSFKELAFARNFAEIGNWKSTTGFGGGDYISYFSVPGVIQWVAGIGKNTPKGGPWTAIMILSFAFSYMGLVLSPNFSMWSYSVKSPRSFYFYQVWGSAGIVGFILFIIIALIGVGAHLLGANEAITNNGFTINNVLPILDYQNSSSLVFNLIDSLNSFSPIIVGFLCVCVLAALQSTIASFIMTTGSILSRDLYKIHIHKDCPWERELLVTRLCTLLVCLASLYLATYFETTLIMFGSLAIAISFQLFPVLLGLVWFKWITKNAAIFGLLTGIFFVILAETIGQKLTGNALPWGRWPLTIYSGLWGLFFNIIICFLASAFSSSDPLKEHRAEFHNFLNSHMGIHKSRKKIRSLAYVLILLWSFFAIGPGLIFGNSMLGKPNDDFSSWLTGLPSLWVYLVIGWASGILLIWFMANKMDLSTLPKKPILNGDDFEEVDEVEDKGNYIDKLGGGYAWPLILIGFAVVTVIVTVYVL